MKGSTTRGESDKWRWSTHRGHSCCAFYLSSGTRRDDMDDLRHGFSSLDRNRVITDNYDGERMFIPLQAYCRDYENHLYNSLRLYIDRQETRFIGKHPDFNVMSSSSMVELNVGRESSDSSPLISSKYNLWPKNKGILDFPENMEGVLGYLDEKFISQTKEEESLCWWHRNKHLQISNVGKNYL